MILVIGAGIAGLTAARALQARGHEVTVVDKGRRPGGRVSTRRILDADADREDLASISFDHGAQYFTVRDTRFATEVEAWHKARVVQVWHGKFAAFDSEGREPLDNESTRWVGIPGMSAIARHLARGLDVQCGVRAIAVEREGSRWRITATGDRTLGLYDAVIVGVPAPQAVPLLSASPTLSRAAAAVSMHPCWAALVAFEDPVSAPFDAAFVTSSPLGWIARDRSKPRRGLAETWVLHGSAAWSTAHLEDDAEAVGPFLLNAFADLVRARLPRPVHLSAHRWRLACADPPASVGAVVDPALGLVACGDWCAGNRIEGAYLSGLAAAGAL